MNMARPDIQCEKVISYINSAIKQNVFPPGSKLPAEEALAKKLSVSRVTVRSAFKTLQDSGIINKEFHKGAFVSRTKPKEAKKIIPFISQYNNATNSRFFELFNGIQDSVTPLDLYPLLTISGYDSNKEREIITDFFDQGYRHMMIMSGFSDRNIELYHTLMQRGVNFVFLDKKPTSLACDYVTCDNFQGGYEAARHLLKLGHKKIAVYITQSASSASTITDRINGFSLALKENGLYRPELFIDWAEKPAEEFADKLTAQHPDVTAVFCTADIYAIPLASYIKKNKLNISVVGFDDLKESESNTPGLTTVRQPFYNLGFEAGKLISDRILYPDRPFISYTIPIKLIERESSFILK